MASIRQMLASVGVGMAGVAISLDRNEHPRGSPVTGKIVVTGGWAAQKVESIILYLEAYSNEAGTRAGALEAHRLEAPFTLLPHAIHSYAFTFDMPAHAPLTLGVPGTRGCRVRAVAAIPRALDPGALVHLNVTLNREIQAVQAAFERAGFKEIAVSTHAADPPPEVTRATYYPPADLRRSINEVILFIQVERERTRGELCLTPSREGLQGRVNALAGVYSHRYPLRFLNEQLVTPAGELVPEGALPRVHEIVDLLAAEIAEQQNTLLRPAFAPEGDLLLRPAAGAGGSDPDKLLRPDEDQGNESISIQ